MIAPLGTSVVSLAIIAVVHGLYSWVGLPISFCPLAVCTESLMLRAGSQGGGVQVSSISNPPSHDGLKCVTSSAIGTCLRVLRGNQGQWQ